MNGLWKCVLLALMVVSLVMVYAVAGRRRRV